MVLVGGTVQAVATRRPRSSTTRSPSSLTNSPRCAGRRSSTSSDGRHRRTPWGETTTRPVHQDRVRLDGVEQLLVGQRGVAEAEFRVGRALLAQEVTDRDARPLGEPTNHGPARRRLEVLDDVRLDAGVADQGQGVARRAAIRVVVDDDVHHATSGRGEVAPASWPISRTLDERATWSRLARGSATKAEMRFLR